MVAIVGASLSPLDDELPPIVREPGGSAVSGSVWTSATSGRLICFGGSYPSARSAVGSAYTLALATLNRRSNRVRPQAGRNSEAGTLAFAKASSLAGGG